MKKKLGFLAMISALVLAFAACGEDEKTDTTPTAAPTTAPTKTPSPTATPTVTPTAAPTAIPTKAPIMYNDPNFINNPYSLLTATDAGNRGAVSLKDARDLSVTVSSNGAIGKFDDQGKGKYAYYEKVDFGEGVDFAELILCVHGEAVGGTFKFYIDADCTYPEAGNAGDPKNFAPGSILPDFSNAVYLGRIDVTNDAIQYQNNWYAATLRTSFSRKVTGVHSLLIIGESGKMIGNVSDTNGGGVRVGTDYYENTVIRTNRDENFEQTEKFLGGKEILGIRFGLQDAAMYDSNKPEYYCTMDDVNWDKTSGSWEANGKVEGVSRNKVYYDYCYENPNGIKADPAKIYLGGYNLKKDDDVTKTAYLCDHFFDFNASGKITFNVPDGVNEFKCLIGIPSYIVNKNQQNGHNVAYSVKVFVNDILVEEIPRLEVLSVNIVSVQLTKGAQEIRIEADDLNDASNDFVVIGNAGFNYIVKNAD